ncbi:MAG: RNA polymerase sigma-70 factor [Paludibacteraceae bacterium]
MTIKDINQEVILRLSNGDEKAFSLLYDSYYVYLNSVALFYVFDKDIANEIVNDVFINIWKKRAILIYPIHSYLVQSVKNGCLNNIRARKINEKVLNGHKAQMLDYQEEYILSNPAPMQYVEMLEIERQVTEAIGKLPEKCRIIFELYIFSAKSPEDIASELTLSVSTVRVQIKNAVDKLRISLESIIQ